MGTLLEVKDLRTQFFTQDGVVNAVNGISYTVDEGETLAIVGESGCGKSVGVMSLIRLIPMPPGKIVGGEVWFDGRTLTSCANDLHGPYLGRDGWFYWCKGGFAEQVYDLPGRAQWHTRAAHIFRSRPDGTGIEPVLTGGMDNPIDVAFTARGERLLSSTFLTHPSGGLRDGLVHALYGGVYGKQHSVLDGHARTGDLLAPLVQMGPAAVCGLHAHSGAGFGEDYCGDLFACAFNLRKVSRHHLVPQGSTFLSSESDFLESDSADFHPTDVIEDADVGGGT